MPTKEEQRASLDQYMDGFYACYVIDTGTQAGLFKTLAPEQQGLTVEEIATRLGLHANYVRVWCQTAYHFGLLDWHDERYSLAPHMDDLLANPEDPAFFSPHVALSRHSHFLETHAAFMKTGQVDHTHHTHEPARTEMMARTAERVRGPLFLSSVLPNLDGAGRSFQEGGRLLDVGCGSGMFIAKLAESLPRCHFSGVDISQSDIDYGRTRIKDKGLGDRVQIEVSSAESISFADEFDAVTMVIVFHELEAKEAAVANCFRALKPGGQFIVIDPDYPNNVPDFRNPSFKAGIMDQYFEMTWGHVHLIRPETEALLSRAGFREPLWHHPAVGRGLYWMVARKPPA